MKKIIKLTESDLEKIIKKVMSEQTLPQAKFTFAFENSTTDFEGEITKDGFLLIETEMGQKFKVGPIDGVPFVGDTLVQVERGKGVEKIYIFGKSRLKRELKFKPNFTIKKIK